MLAELVRIGMLKIWYIPYGISKILTIPFASSTVQVVDDQIGCPTWTVELANGIVKILDMPYGIYHICGSGQTSWFGFAQKIFELAKSFCISLVENGGF